MHVRFCGGVVSVGLRSLLSEPTIRLRDSDGYNRSATAGKRCGFNTLEADVDESVTRVWVASADSESADFAADQARMDLHDAMTEALDGGADPQSVWAASNATDSDMMRDSDGSDLPGSA